MQSICSVVHRNFLVDDVDIEMPSNDGEESKEETSTSQQKF